MNVNAAIAINNDVLFRIRFIPPGLSQPPFVPLLNHEAWLRRISQALLRQTLFTFTYCCFGQQG
jgi:hypothetical protein